MNKLQPNEVQLLIEFCDNYYEDDVPGAAALMPVIKRKLENYEELEKHELVMIRDCIEVSTSDFDYKKNNLKEWNFAISILKKLIDLTK